MERYKISYLWKSLHGYVPSLGIRKKDRDSSKLAFPKVYGKEGVVRTLQQFSLRWEGMSLYNSLPTYLIVWEGTK